MAKRKTVEEQLGELSRLRVIEAGALKSELAKYLASPTNIVVAKAAELARDAKVEGLEKELVEAFEQFMKRPGELDKGCAALKGVVKALLELNCTSEGAVKAYLWGLRHVQREGYGGEDVAAELRGLSAIGLVQARHRGVMELLVEMIAEDADAVARGMAARAIAYAAKPESAMLLRLKALVGDEEMVVAECLSGVARLEGVGAIGFLKRFLEDQETPGLAGAAAMALGEMKRQEALDVLMECWARALSEGQRQELLLPIALSRRPEAHAFLIGVIQSGPERLARLAVEAMGMYRHDSTVREKVRAAVEQRADASVSQRYASVFGA